MPRQVLSRPVPTLRRICAEWSTGRSGSVGFVFGLLLLPMMVAMGVSVDYARVSAARSDLAAAADAAVLSVTNKAAMSLDMLSAQARVRDAFLKNIQTMPDISGVSADAVVIDLLGVRAATLSYTASYRTAFSGILGMRTLSVSGNAASKSAVPIYMDFYLLLDNSPSMGVGATSADISTMVSRTPDKCAFACHDLSAGNSDYYHLAKSLGVTMRIDVVRQATQRLMDTAANTALVPGQFRTALYTMGADCASVGLTTVSPLSSDLAAAKTNAQAIDLMTIQKPGYNNDQCTDFDGVFQSLNGKIDVAGDGSTALTPQKVVFLVSDGVADAYYPSTCTRKTTGGRCQEPLTLANCTTLKNRGIKIAVLYTTYLPLPTNDWYNTWIAPFQATLPSAMQGCASPGLYFEVSPTQGIADAMTTLFQRTVSQPRLTQ